MKSAIVVLGLLFAGMQTAHASARIDQELLPGDCIPMFAMPLPVFGPAGGIPRVDAKEHRELTVTMQEIEQAVLPSGMTDTCGLGVTFRPTRVWAYEITDSFTHQVLGPAHWPGVTVEARRFIPAVMTYVNKLPALGGATPYGPALVQGLVSVDQTIHWANPDHNACMMMVEMMPDHCTMNPTDVCCQPFVGPPPAVVHLHGGEVPSSFDGGPEQWFTSDGKTGQDYRTLYDAGPGKAVYRYPNFQEPGTLFFHDHALGSTRTNLYSGLAAFYLIRDHAREPRNLPSGAYEVELALQDRQFDTNSQLVFPDGHPSNLADPPNPGTHPFWVPEFVGDVNVVNGVPWPYMNVEPRRYLFRLVDGANARFYRLSFGAAPVYQVGADDAFFDKPVPISTLTLGPGERANIIVDFTGLAGEDVTVMNDAPIPFPDGFVPGVDQPGMLYVMRFHVGSAPVCDTSCDPALGQCRRPVPVTKLTTGLGQPAPGVRVARVRQLVLKEVMGEGGPLAVLVNNTRWDGLRSPSIAAVFPDDGVSERPRVGSVELWEIINLTMDAHPMHTHLTQFQVVNRQDFDTDESTGYPAAWEAAFGTGPVPLPAGCMTGAFCPFYGPPLPYSIPNQDGAIGGNPALSGYLRNLPQAPMPGEVGWKDTAKAYPGQVLRILVRWTPTSVPAFKGLGLTGLNFYPFDPTVGPGYVWHCHIVDHEDNEMMRPYRVVK